MSAVARAFLSAKRRSKSPTRSAFVFRRKPRANSDLGKCVISPVARNESEPLATNHRLVSQKALAVILIGFARKLTCAITLAKPPISCAAKASSIASRSDIHPLLLRHARYALKRSPQSDEAASRRNLLIADQVIK